MAHVSGKRILRSIAVYDTWPIERKNKYWIARPIPNGIPFRYSMPLLLWLRDYLKIAENRREASYLVNNNKVFVNFEKPDLYQSVGLFDVIYIKDLDKYYRVSINQNGKLFLVETDEKDGKLKIIRIIRKNTVKGGRIQVTGIDGRNFLLDNVNTGDSILYDLKEKKVVDIIKMEPGNMIFIFDGAKVGEIGYLKNVEIHKRTFGTNRFVVYEDLNKEEKRTIWDYTVVIGKDKPLIKIK